MQVGQRPAALLPQAELQVIPDGDHNLGSTFAAVVAPLIDRHLASYSGILPADALRHTLRCFSD